MSAIVAPGMSGIPVSWSRGRTLGGSWRDSISAPLVSTTARSTAFSSSRTLPGQP